MSLEMLQDAVNYQQNGFKVFRVKTNAKTPARRGWQQEASLNEQFAMNAFGYGMHNIGVSCENFSVLDFDDKERGLEFVRQRQDIVTTVVETRKGIHGYFSGLLRNYQCDDYDIRSVGGYVVGAGSVVDGWTYRFLTPLVPVSELKPFPKEMIPERKEVQREPEIDSFRKITRAKAYGVTVKCFAGQKAHNQLFRFVCWMRDLGLSQSEAFAVLLSWNETNCFDESGKPFPWTHRELAHKIESSYR